MTSGGRSRHGDPDQEGAHGGRHVDPLGQTGRQQRDPQDRQQVHLVGVGERRVADPLAMANGQRQGDADREQRDDDRQRRSRQAAAESDRAEDRKDHGHRQVFEHQHGQHQRRFAVA